MKRLIALLVGTALAVSLVAACGSDGKQDYGYYHYTGATKLGTLIPSKDRHKVHSFKGSLLSGKGDFNLSEYAGKITVINFWGSWCPPCRAESSALVQVANASGSKGVTFVGVDERDTKPNALSFDRGHGVIYPSVFDEDGSIAAQWPAAAGPPYTFIIDRQGRIAARFLGGVTAGDLQSAVDKVTAEA
jgi:thiol-disulfide isomerase/thioredoxin